jgi:hypothetical protein
VTGSKSPLFPSEIVECLSDGRGPSVAELFSVAERIWVDVGPDRSAFDWGQLPPAAPDRLSAVRAALFALSGGDAGA